jgi:hypothetical protein
MNKNLQFTIYNLQFLVFLFLLSFNVYAVSPTASPSATPLPASSEEEKIQEIRQAIKDQVTEIKNKIEKKAYVGNIFEITDSTITLSNFRGKQRVRITEETTIINASKKEIPIKDLALEDKIIALGETDANETLESKRIMVVAPLKNIPAKRMIFCGTVNQVNTKTSTLTISPLKQTNPPLNVKIDKSSYLFNLNDSSENLVFGDFSQGQKVTIIYPETAEGKIPLAKTIFLLP